MPSAYAPTPGLSGSSVALKKWSVLSAVLPTSSSCALFTASVSSVPAATLVIWRSLPALPPDTLLSQIGRASCRERVCQYVQLSEVDVSCKNKTTKNQLIE